MSNKGWICVDRKLTDHWLWEDKPFSRGQAWIDLLLRASHSGKKFRLGNELIEIEPGQFITSEAKLADTWGWSRHKTRDFLSLLESDHMIVRKADNKRTAITIVKWGDYQNLSTAKDTAEGHQKDIKRTSKGLHRDTINNDNNYNNVNNDNKAAEAAVQLQQLQISEDIISQTINLWNKQSCTQPIKRIMRDRLNNMAVCMGNDSERFLEVVGSIDKQEFLRNRTRPLTFDWFIQPENFEKVADGNYRNTYSAEGGRYGQVIDWAAVGSNLG